MSEQINPAPDKTKITYQYLCELAVISKRRGTTDAFIDVALQFAGEAVVAVQQLQQSLSVSENFLALSNRKLADQKEQIKQLQQRNERLLAALKDSRDFINQSERLAHPELSRMSYCFGAKLDAIIAAEGRKKV